jgi:hypothetical protein
VNVLDIEHGVIDIKWSGRVLSARIPDVRRHLPFIAFMDDHTAPVVAIRNHLLS